jgi:sulfatase maturation enzyme AslB (radical SAM superfamily)
MLSPTVSGLPNAVWVDEHLFCGVLLRFFVLRRGQARVDLESNLASRRTSIALRTSSIPRGPLRNAILRNATFEVCRRCNLSCRYCYGRRKRQSRDMSTDTSSRAIEILKNTYRGVRSVSFTGGEPLLRLDTLLCILSHCTSRYLKRVTVFTNGTVHMRAALHSLQPYPVRWVVSLDGPEDIHNQLRGKGTYARVRRSLDEISRMGSQLWIEATYTPLHLQQGMFPEDVEKLLASWYPNATCVSASPVASTFADLQFSHRQRIEISMSRTVGLKRALCDFVDGISINLPEAFLRPTAVYLAKTRDDRFCPVSRLTRVTFPCTGGAYPCLFFSDRPEAAYDLSESSSCSNQLDGINTKDNRIPCRNCYARFLCFGCPGRLIVTWPSSARLVEGERILAGTCTRGPFFDVLLPFLLQLELRPQLMCRVKNAIRSSQQ